MDLARAAGVYLDPWQELAVELILAEAKDGNWAAFETALLVARQNGKGEIILVLELAGLFLLGETLLLHSAHEFKTSREAYLRIKAVIEGCPDLLRHVKQFRQSNEDTSVELRSGARLRFMARSRQTGRGFSAQRLLVDEAQILSRAAMGALMPTLAAQANPQINYFGTVPTPADCSEHFTDLRDRGRGEGDGFLAWLEWNIGEECTDLDDRAAWWAGNTAGGGRVTEDAIARMRASLSDDDFAREVLSIWPTTRVDAEERPISAEAWARGLVARDGPGWLADPVAMAIDATPDGSWATIAVAGDCPEGGVGVEVAEHHAGLDWVPARVAELVAAHGPKVVLLDGRSAAAALVRPLADRGVDVVELGSREVIRACGELVADVSAGRVHHRGRQVLDEAVQLARRRPVGDAWVWERKGMVACPLVAVTLARWGQLEVEAPPVDVAMSVW